MPNIKYRVPYEIRVRAGDLASGKNVSNAFYVKVPVQLVSPPAYGQPIAGGGDTATLLASFKTAFESGPLTMLSAKYVLTGYEMRSLEGWSFGGATFPITAVGVGLPTTIQVVSTGGLVTGDLVSINGVVGATNANGVWTITVVDGTKFTITANTSLQIWGGGGSWQAAAGAKRWNYGQLEYLASTAAGALGAEAVTLFATASVRRRSVTAGKSFQGRNSYSPIPEASVENGTFTTSAKAGWVTGLNTFMGPFLNGGTEVPGSGNSFLYNVSKRVAFAQVSPFIESADWSAIVAEMTLQPDMGSLIRRKPRLSSVITP